MACNLSKGFAIPCKDISGGISAIYLTNKGSIATVTYSGDQISDMTGTIVIFKYELNGSANAMTTTLTSSKENGTTFYSTSLSVTLPKLSKEQTAELKLISYGHPSVIVVDRNNNAFLLGTVNGCSLESATIQTGGAFGDMSGMVLEFLAEEISAPDFINGATTANPLAAMSSASVTVTAGTNS